MFYVPKKKQYFRVTLREERKVKFEAVSFKGCLMTPGPLLYRYELIPVPSCDCIPLNARPQFHIGISHKGASSLW